MGKMFAEGVTLIELMVTLATVGVVLSIGVPAMADLFALNRMSATTNDFVTLLHVSRNEAVKSGEQVVMCSSTTWNNDDSNCTDTSFGDGLIVFVDPNRNGTRDDGETLVMSQGPAGTGITLTATDNLVVFSSTGAPSVDPFAADIDFLLCDGRGNSTSGGIKAGRLVTMTPTGRPQVLSSGDRVDCSG